MKTWIVYVNKGNYSFTEKIEADYYQQEGHLVKFYIDKPSESLLDPVTVTKVEVKAYSVFRLISIQEEN